LLLSFQVISRRRACGLVTPLAVQSQDFAAHDGADYPILCQVQSEKRSRVSLSAVALRALAATTPDRSLKTNCIEYLGLSKVDKSCRIDSAPPKSRARQTRDNSVNRGKICEHGSRKTRCTKCVGGCCCAHGRQKGLCMQCKLLGLPYYYIDRTVKKKRQRHKVAGNSSSD
jgi:hypothetical protein